MKTKSILTLAVIGLFFILSFQNTCQAEMVGQWLFEEGPDGTTFWDTSGKGNHGTLSGDFAWSADAPNGELWSLYSTSADFEAIVQDDDILDITDDFTIKARVKVATSGFFEVISKHHDHGDYDGSWNMYVSRDGNNDVMIQMGAYGNWTTVESEKRLISTDSWVDIVVTYDDSENKATFYINSTVAGIRDVDWEINNTVEPVTFGYEPNPSNPHANIGDNRIGSVTMYNHVILEPVLVVEIDIKPDSNDNPINLGSRGLTPVAIFSMVGFDATSVDPNSIELAGAAVAMRGKGKFMAHEEDVDGDGMVDLVVQVVTADIDPALLQLDGDVVYAVLTGSTTGGEAIESQDNVTIVPAEK